MPKAIEDNEWSIEVAATVLDKFALVCLFFRSIFACGPMISDKYERYLDKFFLHFCGGDYYNAKRTLWGSSALLLVLNFYFCGIYSVQFWSAFFLYLSTTANCSKADSILFLLKEDSIRIRRQVALETALITILVVFRQLYSLLANAVSEEQRMYISAVDFLVLWQSLRVGLIILSESSLIPSVHFRSQRRRPNRAQIHFNNRFGQNPPVAFLRHNPRPFFNHIPRCAAAA